jgi:hypothetical protein
MTLYSENSAQTTIPHLNYKNDKGAYMDRPFVNENTRERKRLISLVDCLTGEELNLTLGNDWTIAIALAHLAFWDQRSLFLI